MRRAACGPLAGRPTRVIHPEQWDQIAAPAGWETADLGRELRRRVLAYALEHCLTAAQREAVELCYGQGMTAASAARQLGVAPSTICRRLTRALGRLRGVAGG